MEREVQQALEILISMNWALWIIAIMAIIFLAGGIPVMVLFKKSLDRAADELNRIRKVLQDIDRRNRGQ